MTTPNEFEQQVKQFQAAYHSVFNEISKVIVGHADIVHGVLTCLFCGGHALLEGVPGLGKTLLVRTLSQVLHLDFNRIQFTPDLMPSDIMGTNIINETPDGQRVFSFQPGPLFAQIVLADEINRATPKTQSALLEAMQEHSVTVGGTVHRLQEPFFVMATQNPLEQEGTYPLPEAQLDRFFFKLLVNYSTREEMNVILERTTKNEFPQPDKIMDGAAIQHWQRVARTVLIAPQVQDYAIRLILATHPGGAHVVGPTNRLIRCGASPRGGQALVLAAKVRAMLEGRYNVSFEDVRQAYLPALRHRILLNFEAQAENIAPDAVLSEIMAAVKEKAPDMPMRNAS
jgi:MoxR-like ATPase